MSQFEEIPSQGRGFQGARVLGNRALAACKTLASRSMRSALELRTARDLREGKPSQRSPRGREGTVGINTSAASSGASP